MNWLDARDGETARRAWETLGATRVEVGRWQPLSPQIERMLGIRPDAAALLAAAFLGVPPERFAWFTIDWTRLNDTHPALRQKHRPPPPIFEVSRTVPRCQLDGHVMCEHECHESWEIREVIEGTRGVQHIRIDHYWGEQTRDGSGGGGGSATFVRVFDRSTARAVSIRLHWDVFTIGEPIDLTPLDLFGDRTEFKLGWKTLDVDSVRGLVAQLTADLDAHFDTSTSWPVQVVEDRVVDNKEYNFRIRLRQLRFEAGAFAITIDQRLDADDLADETGAATVKVHGLPWGHTLTAYLNPSDDPVFGVSGSLDLRLPRTQLEATLARLAAIPNIAITY